jgi:hypothetical protein
MSLEKGISGALSGAQAGAMIGGTPGAIVGGAIGLVGGLFSGNEEQKKAERLAREVDAIIADLGLPPNTAKPLLLQKFKVEGLYTPELEQYIDLKESEAGKVQEDPSLRESQMGALRLMAQRADAGLTAQDRAAFNKLRNEVAAQEQGRQKSIIQEMQARGQGGSGAELVARLLSSQASANRAAQEGDDIAAAASRNALEAVARYGTMSGEIRRQDFETASKIAEARDLRNKMLYENSVNMQQRNVRSQNEGKMFNINKAQEVSDANVRAANEELKRQVEAQAKDYENRRILADMKIKAKTGNYNAINAAQQLDSEKFSNIVSGVAKTAPEIWDSIKKYNANSSSTNKSTQPEEKDKMKKS